MFSIFLGTSLGLELLDDYFSDAISHHLFTLPLCSSLSQWGSIPRPPHHSPYFKAFMLLPPLLFSLRSFSFLSFWVQILCVTKGPTQLTFFIKASSRAASWESHATPCVCFLTPDLLALDCSYSVPRSHYHLRVYSSLPHLDSDFWIYVNIPTALYTAGPE